MFVNQIYVKLFSFFAHYHPLTVIAGIYFDLQTDQMEEKEILVLKTWRYLSIAIIYYPFLYFPPRILTAIQNTITTFSINVDLLADRQA